MYDRLEDLPTSPFVRALGKGRSDHTTVRRSALPAALLTDADSAEALTTTLPVPARIGFRLLCDVEAIPAWLSVIGSARVLERRRDGRARRAAFIGQLQGASIGYTLHYRYWDDRLMVAWATAPGGATQVSGRARFSALGETACMMQYELSISMPRLAPWSDEAYEGHPLSATISEFREYVDRQRALIR